MTYLYEKVSTSQGFSLIRKDRVFLVRKLEGLIFDCDGVIFDVSESFRSAIMLTVNWFFNVVMGFSVDELAKPDHIQLLKDSGGFNNDWELTYALVLYYLTTLIIDALTKSVHLKLPSSSSVSTMNEAYSLFRELGRMLRKRGVQLKPATSLELEEYIEEAGNGGLRSVEEVSARRVSAATGISTSHAKAVLDALSPFKGDLYGTNIIKRYFEELYSGKDLFVQVYRVHPVFHRGEGLIEKEKLIVRREALAGLISFGFPPIGIASGRLRKQTLPIIERYGVERFFNLPASTFLEEVKEKEEELLRVGVSVKLEKPNPYSLLSTASKMGIREAFGYVGDTVSDVLASINAEKESKYSVMSIGVLCSTVNKARTIEKFLELGCDIIAPSPNELPEILAEVC